MNRSDFLHLIGGNETSEYVPVAFLLRGGHGVAGYFNGTANRGLIDSVVLANARLVEFQQARAGQQAVISDFSEFLEQIVQRQFRAEESPVSKIGQMMHAMDTNAPGNPPAFLDFENKSIILKVLRTKIW
jgi:hypothetical protein